jgi:hypothetical protein
MGREVSAATAGLSHRSNKTSEAMAPRRSKFIIDLPPRRAPTPLAGFLFLSDPKNFLISNLLASFVLKFTLCCGKIGKSLQTAFSVTNIRKC